MSSTPGPSSLADYIASNASFDNPQSHASPLPSLYADLSRQRKSNPSGYRASIDWWSSTLTDTTFLGLLSSPSSDSLPDRTVLRLDENVKAKWTVDGVGRPLGLGTVISELEKDASVVRLDSFLRSSKPIEGPASLRTGAKGLRGYLPTPGGVASALLLTPAKWAASQLISLATGGSDADDGEYSEDEQLFKAKRGDWVVYALVHRIASAFLARHFDEASLSPLSSLLSPAEFRDKLAEVCRAEFGFTPSERDAKLVLKHLARDRGGVVTSQPDIIKVSPTEHEPAQPITDEDRGIVAVKSTLNRIEAQITSLEGQINSRNEQIKSSLRANNKPHATSYLRSRKALQEVLDKRMATRENLTAVVLKIEQAKGDVEVMRAYSASSDVLGSVLKSDELRMENVDRVVGELEERLASQREVDDAIRGVDVGGVGAAGVDEDEVQDELEQLLREKRAEEDAEKEKKEKQRQDEEAEKSLKERFEKLRLGSTGPTDMPTATSGEKQDATTKQVDIKTPNESQQQPIAE